MLADRIVRDGVRFDRLIASPLDEAKTYEQSLLLAKENENLQITPRQRVMLE